MGLGQLLHRGTGPVQGPAVFGRCSCQGQRVVCSGEHGLRDTLPHAEDGGESLNLDY